MASESQHVLVRQGHCMDRPPALGKPCAPAAGVLVADAETAADNDEAVASWRLAFDVAPDMGALHNTLFQQPKQYQ